MCATTASSSTWTVITPGPETVEFPGLLDFERPTLRAYPRATVVAEKVEAVVQLGLANSRMKDFFDVVVLSRTFPFDGDELARAIRSTFERRGTALPVGLPTGLTNAFAADKTKIVQWAGFLRKAGAAVEMRGPADSDTELQTRWHGEPRFSTT